MKMTLFKLTFHTEFSGTKSGPIVTYLKAFWAADAVARLHKSPVWCNVPKSVLIVDEVVAVK